MAPQLDGVLPSRHEHHVVLELCNGGSLRAWLDQMGCDSGGNPGDGGGGSCTATGMGKAPLTPAAAAAAAKEAVTLALSRAQAHISSGGRRSGESGETPASPLPPPTVAPSGPPLAWRLQPQQQQQQQLPGPAVAARASGGEEAKPPAAAAGGVVASPPPPAAGGGCDVTDHAPAPGAAACHTAAACSAAAATAGAISGILSRPEATAISAPEGLFTSPAAAAAAAALAAAAAAAASASPSLHAGDDIRSGALSHSQSLAHPASRRLPGLTSEQSQQLMLLSLAWVAEGSSEVGKLAAAAAEVTEAVRASTDGAAAAGARARGMEAPGGGGEGECTTSAISEPNLDRAGRTTTAESEVAAAAVATPRGRDEGRTVGDGRAAAAAVEAAEVGIELRRCSHGSGNSSRSSRRSSSSSGGGDGSSCSGDGDGDQPNEPVRSSASSSLAAGPAGLGSPVASAHPRGPGPPAQETAVAAVSVESDCGVAAAAAAGDDVDAAGPAVPVLEEALEPHSSPLPPPTADLAAAWAGPTLGPYGTNPWVIDNAPLGEQSSMPRPGSSAGSLTSYGRRIPSVAAHQQYVILDDLDEQEEYERSYGEYGSTFMYGNKGGSSHGHANHNAGGVGVGGGGRNNTARHLYGHFGSSMVDEPLRRLEEESSLEGTQSSRGRSRGDATGTTGTGVTSENVVAAIGGCGGSSLTGEKLGSGDGGVTAAAAATTLSPPATATAAAAISPMPVPRLLQPLAAGSKAQTLTAAQPAASGAVAPHSPPREGELDLSMMTSIMNRRAAGMVRSIMRAAAAAGGGRDGGGAEAAAATAEPMSTARLRHLVAALECLVEVAAGLSYLHGVGMVHGDVKSGNVLLALEEGLTQPHPHCQPHMGRGFRVKLADFGFARVIEHGSHTYLSRPSGTLAYLSPELLTAHRQSTAADMYAFGLLVWEVVTREPLFRGMQTPQLLYAKTHHSDWQHLPWPVWVPPEVAALARSCAEYLPARRLSAGQARG
ncbi:hypothetical protein Agub_g9453, partial [Astrephomene gubernaculifera]